MHRECGGAGVLLNREGRKSLTEKRTFHANPEGGEEASHADPQGEHSSRGNSKGKGPGQEGRCGGSGGGGESGRRPARHAARPHQALCAIVGLQLGLS